MTTKDDGLEGQSRKALDELAHQHGVEDPEKLPNKPAVVAAIREKRAASGAELDPVTGEPWRATVNGEDITGDQAKGVALRNRDADAQLDAEGAKVVEGTAPQAPPAVAIDTLDRSQLGGLGGATVAPGTPDGIPPALQQRIDNVKEA